jgi:hypothetical protein
MRLLCLKTQQQNGRKTCNQSNHSGMLASKDDGRRSPARMRSHEICTYESFTYENARGHRKSFARHNGAANITLAWMACVLFGNCTTQRMTRAAHIPIADHKEGQLLQHNEPLCILSHCEEPLRTSSHCDEPLCPLSHCNAKLLHTRPAILSTAISQ